MDFLGIGAGEIVLIILVVLLLWGPGKVVETSRSLGKMMHDFRSSSNKLTEQINKELEEQSKETSLKSPPVEIGEHGKQ